MGKGIFDILIFFMSLILILLGVMDLGLNLNAFTGFIINKMIIAPY